MKRIFTIAIFLLVCMHGYPQFQIYSLHISFESNGQYAVVNTQQPDNLWQKGTPSKTFFDSAYSVPYAIVTDTIHLYPAGNMSSFTVTIRKSDCWGMGFLSFVHKYQTDTLRAGGYVEVAYDTSTQFYNIIYDTVQPLTHPSFMGFYSKYDTLEGGPPAFQGNSGQWVFSSVHWIWEVGVKSPLHDSLTLKFNFRSNADAIPKEGWMIDDIDFHLFGCTGGINEISSALPYAEISPDPFHGTANCRMVNFPPDSYHMTIYNSLGDCVMEVDPCSYPDFMINSGTLPPGLYFYGIGNKEHQVFTGKFIVN